MKHCLPVSVKIPKLPLNIDEETKKNILEAIAGGEVFNESDKRDIETIEIKEEQISMLVKIIEDKFA